MAKISAKQVNELRKATGAGMMDCKKALVEANGDFEAAIEYLRKKGQKVAAKRAERAATEGAAIAKTNADATLGVALVLSCETDFVAKNEDFISFAHAIADVALSNGITTKEALLAAEIDGVSIATKITENVGKIGEKIEVSKFETLKSASVIPYIHMGNRIAVLLGLNQANSETSEAAGKNVAMQVAAMRPVAVSEDNVPQEIIDKELEIGREQAIAEGKPAQIIDKIAQGKLKKYFKDNTLVNQQYVKDSSKTVKAYLNSEVKDLSVTDFRRLEIG